MLISRAHENITSFSFHSCLLKVRAVTTAEMIGVGDLRRPDKGSFHVSEGGLGYMQPTYMGVYVFILSAAGIFLSQVSTSLSMSYL